VCLDRIREQEAVKDPDTGLRATVSQQRADALVSLARRGLGADSDVERSTVVLHADLALVTGDDPAGHATVGAQPVAAEVMRRHLCDGRIEWAVDGPDGRTVGVGRATRRWPAWLARQIRHRDGERCRVPGCPNRIHQIHHIRGWFPDGTTDTANGVGLCWTNHVDVHHGRLRIEGNADGELVFTTAGGKQLRSPPRRMTPEVKALLRDVTPRLHLE
jgi:hypothetical protein